MLKETSFSLESIEKAPLHELRALQLKRLQSTLAHAYANSPVYRVKWDEAGVKPSGVQTLADLAKFPFTTKKDLRDAYPFAMFAVRAEFLIIALLFDRNRLPLPNPV